MQQQLHVAMPSGQHVTVGPAEESANVRAALADSGFMLSLLP
jgi:hypothetical protein